METSLTQHSARRRAPLSALTKLTIAALISFAGVLVFAQVFLGGQFSLEQTIFVVVLLVVAGVIATGWRWTPLLAAVLCGAIMGGGSDVIINDLRHPESFRFFASVLFSVVVTLIGIVAGIGATVQNYRARERRAPRIMVPALIVVASIYLGAIMVAAIPRQASAGIDPTILAGLAPITTPAFTFDQPTLTAKVGETVALRFQNTHTAPHSFDIDELNVHVPAAPGAQTLILFKPTTPGTYTFYCAVPGHRALGMQGTLVVEQ